MSVYYQFVNFIQGLSNLWFSTVVIILFAVTVISIVKFFKIYNGTQKSFEKLSLLFLALVLFAILIFLTYIRK